jgi:hypothetical protein
MIEQLTDMPEGAIGFRGSGRLTSRDYHDTLLPVIREALESGRTVNLLFATAPDFSGLDMGALWEDTKAAGTIGLKHLSSWGRIALVTDKDWMRHAISAFGWISPGEYRVFEPDEYEAAKTWLSEAGD